MAARQRREHVLTALLAVGAAIPGGALAGAVVVGGISANAATALATAFLAIVTVAYVVVVHRQLSELRRQTDTQASQWAEQREADRQAREQERSEAAAWIALEAIYEPGLRPGADESLNAGALHLFHVLEQRAPFVTTDPEMADRMKATGVVCWMLSWSDDALARDKVSKGLLGLRAREMAERCSWSLQRFLVGEPLPTWDDLPAYVEAQGWVWRECRATVEDRGQQARGAPDA